MKTKFADRLENRAFSLTYQKFETEKSNIYCHIYYGS